MSHFHAGRALDLRAHLPQVVPLVDIDRCLPLGRSTAAVPLLNEGSAAVRQQSVSLTFTQPLRPSGNPNPEGVMETSGLAFFSAGALHFPRWVGIRVGVYGCAHAICAGLLVGGLPHNLQQLLD